MKNQVKTNRLQHIFRFILAFFMIYAGFSHLSFNRMDFQAQVPDWLPLSKDLVVILSGIVEMILGLWLGTSYIFYLGFSRKHCPIFGR